MSNRPNILYIFTDQQYAGAMSCAGNKDLTTPAMDSLAKTGVLFEKAYCTQPLCTPSRASMFTGLMPYEIDVTSNDKAISDHLRKQELGSVFEPDYECVYAGKWHVPEISMPEGHGFRNLSDFGDKDLAERCVEFLKQGHNRPFLLVVSFDNPHNICEWARNQKLPWGQVPRVFTEECPDLPVNFAIPPFEPEAIRIEQSTPKGVHPTSGYTDEHWRQYRHAYYRLVEKVDAELGRILDALRDQGLEENTLVIFSSDHGDGLGAHHWNQKSVLYEESIRVPFIVSFKDVTKAGHVDDTHLISNGLDLFPTLCDYADIKVPDGLRGRTVRPLAEGLEDEWRDQVIVETLFGPPGYQGTQGRMVRTQRYKYMVYSWGQYREQLIDMKEDPGEMVNLAVNNKYQVILQEHRERLARWCKETGDHFDVLIPGL